jgi:hypothetical protein
MEYKIFIIIETKIFWKANGNLIHQGIEKFEMKLLLDILL